MRYIHIQLVILLCILSSMSTSQMNKDTSVISWQQINSDGFGNPDNVAVRGMTVFQDTLVVGVDNIDFYFCLDRVIKESLENHTWPSTHEMYRRLESNGCEIWSYNGSSWRQCIGDHPSASLPSGFGNEHSLGCSSLIVFNGFLYAGLWNHKEGCQIWRTSNLMDWEQVVTEGFGDPTNTAAWIVEVFNGWLYVGTMNFDKGCEVYRTQDGVSWEAVIGGDAAVSNGVGMGAMNYYAWSMTVYGNSLYLGTGNAGGCELWRTSDGVSWQPVIAYGNIVSARLHGALSSRGFGRKVLLIDGIRELTVYNNELYMGLTRPLFWGVSLQTDWGWEYLRLPVYPMLGAQIWKYTVDNNSLLRVVGGVGDKPWRNGFGDRQNFEIWSMETSNGCLYAGTMKPIPTYVTLQRNKAFDWSVYITKQQGSGQLWEFNGNEWNCITTNGFGDAYNVGFREMIDYNGSLVVGTMNLETGCELWKSSS